MTMCEDSDVTDRIRFDDGAGYEQYMGKWSRLAGDVFLDWLAPVPGQRWLDVGCGNGAFTEVIVKRCEPASVHGIDPSEAQLAFARSRLPASIAEFHQADAMALPFADQSFDVAVMPLVIFFVPDPARGVAEMARVVRPGGLVGAYGWDMEGGGVPYHSLRDAMRAAGITIPDPPSPDAARAAVLRDLWIGAGLNAVELREITVERTFAGFDEYWTTVIKGPSIGPQLRSMPAADLASLEMRMRALLPADAKGRIVCGARANAVKGRVSGQPSILR
jgi:SAM-dependent methyltransferase